MATIMKVVFITALIGFAIVVWWVIDGERKARKKND